MIVLAFIHGLIAAPALVIYVDPRGFDKNPGTQARPLATLNQAQARVRSALSVPDLRPSSIRVVIKGGTYSLSEPLTFGQADSGTASSPVVWESSNGDSVTISGGVEVGGWTESKAGKRTLWTTTLPKVGDGSWYFRSIYGEDDSRRTRAFLPREGLFTVAGVATRPGADDKDWLNGRFTFTYTQGELDGWKDAREGEIVLFTSWTDSHMPIQSIDASHSIVNCSKSSIQNFAAGAKYRVENVDAALINPGDWTLSRSGTLRYIPKPTERKEKFKLIAPKTQQLMKLDGAQNMTFRGIRFAHANWWFPSGYYADTKNGDTVWGFQQAASLAGAAIEASNVSGLLLENCVLTHTGANGINIVGKSNNVKISRCTFSDIGACAVKFGDKDLPVDPKSIRDEDLTRDIEFSDNEVVGCGKVFNGAAGVLSTHARRIKIIHNNISQLSYTGTSVGWDWGFDNPGISRDNLIAWNHIWNIRHESIGDGAGIYTLGVQPGTLVEYNRVHDIQGRYASRGIYLDDGSSEITVRNNLAYRNKAANFFQWRSRGNIVENNVFGYGTDSQIELGGAVFNDGFPALDFRRNVVLVEGGPILNPFARSDVKSIYSFHTNLYWKLDGSLTIPPDFRAAGWMSESVTGDPGLADPANGDFRFLRSSRALREIGFNPVDWSMVGPRPIK